MIDLHENLSVMIVDDDERSSDAISKIIADDLKELKIQGIYRETGPAIKALREKIPDIVFLDMDMRGNKGMDILKLIPPGLEKNVIYVTGQEQVALDAIKTGVADCLLKPVSPGGVVAAVDHIRAKRQAELFDLRNKLKDKLLINKHDKAVVIDINEIVYMEADGPYTKFVTSDSARIKSSKSLGYYLRLLADKHILQRVNRSFVINFEHIREIIKDENGGGRLVLSNNESIEFSTGMKNRLIQNIQELLSKTIRG